MGVLDKFLSFGSERKGKVIALAIIGVTLVFFVAGILMTSLGSMEGNVNSIALSAPNMVYGEKDTSTGVLTGYHMDATNKENHIIVRPNPITTSAAVVFTTDSPYIRFRENHITAGGTAIFELVKDSDGLYRFFDADSGTDDPILVTVTCGGRSVPVYIRIVLQPEDVLITAELEGTIPNLPGEWHPRENLDMRYFNDATEMYQISRYRVHLTCWVFGERVYDTEALPEHYQYFTYEEIDNNGIYGVELFDEYNDFYVMSNDIPDLVQLTFKISCKFNGKLYFTEPDFLLNIEPWTEL